MLAVSELTSVNLEGLDPEAAVLLWARELEWLIAQEPFGGDYAIEHLTETDEA